MQKLTIPAHKIVRNAASYHLRYEKQDRPINRHTPSSDAASQRTEVNSLNCGDLDRQVCQRVAAKSV